MITFGRTIPVTIYPGFWFVAIAIGILDSLGTDMTSLLIGASIWVSVIFVSVLIHEFGHALTARLFGQRVSIDLVAMGGLTKRWGGPARPSLFKEFIIVFNGPLAGLLLFALAYYVRGVFHESEGAISRYWLNVAVYVNLFWTLVNLLPIQPLDGGKLFSIVLEGIFGFRGFKIALFLSFVLAGALAMLCFAFSIVLPGALFMIFAFEGFRMWNSARPMIESDRDERLQEKVGEAQRLLDSGKIDEAKQLLTEIRNEVPSGVLFVSASELLATCMAAQERFQEAYDLISPVQKQLSPQGLLLLHQLAYRLGHWREAADLGDRVFELQPSYEIALINARCHARLRETEPTIGWLRCALTEGLPDIREELKSPAYEALQGDRAFEELVREDEGKT